jgi:exonuclease III
MIKNIVMISIIYFIYACANPIEKEKNSSDGNNSLLPNLDLQDGIEVVTWNIENFPKLGQRTIDSVASIITSLNADIYCLQEISNMAMFTDLAEILDEYSYVASDATEYLNLVVLYKKNQFIVRNQSSLFTDNMYEFAYRPPLRIEMTFLGQNAIDFTLINMHLKCCDNGFNRRVASSDILYDYLNSSVQAGILNHIVVGDWNDDISDPYSENSFNIFLDDTENYKYVTYENALSGTNIHDSYPSYPSFIDHIMISKDLFDESGDGDVQTLRLGDYISGYDEIISDHRPVVWRFTP